MKSFTFLMVSVIILLYINIIRVNGQEKITTSEIKVAQEIMESETTRDCKDANLSLYIWFRQKGKNPLVQIGKKRIDGEYFGHLWLELEGKIYDVTDPKYFKVWAYKVYDLGDYVLDGRLK